jgi:hypothetical protein
MGPDTRHPEYEQTLPVWKRCRDVVSGEDAVHAAGVAYLPKLQEQTAPEYASYVQRAPFYNATARTIDGLVGMVLRKEPTVEAPAALDDIRADMTLTGCALPELGEQLLREVVGVARVGVLVEYPVQVMGPLTQAQAATMNRRPYSTLYKAEHIINWRTERVNNALQPVMIVLAETVTEWVTTFEAKQIDQRRALLLEDGRYVQRLYRQGEKQWEQFGPDIVPLMNGAPLTYIPFVPFGPDRNELGCQKPPILDLVALNLSHYRTVADYEHGAHFTGLPMLFLAGVQLGEGEKVMLGSQAAVVATDPTADGKYIEFTGQGLGALKDRAAEKEAQMAAIGARMLAPEKSGVEAEGTIRMRHTGESAVLSTIAKMVGAGLTRVLRIMADWEGVTAEVLVTMNTDFVDLSMSAQDIDALVSAWQRGAISRETLFDNLKRGEVIPEGRDFETETAAIDDGAPVLGAFAEASTPATEASSDTPSGAAPQEVVVDTQPIADAIKGMPQTDMAPIFALLTKIAARDEPRDDTALIAALQNMPQPQITVNSPEVNVTTPPVVVNIERAKGARFVSDANGVQAIELTG